MLSTIAAPATCLSLRVRPRRTFSLEAMIASGTISMDAATLLRRMVEAKLACNVAPTQCCLSRPS
jgi:pilus assembly protein CpaF